MSSYPSAGVDAPSAATTQGRPSRGLQDRSGSPGRPSTVKARPPSTIDRQMEALGSPGVSARPSRGFAVAIAIGVVAFTLGVVGYLEAGGFSVATSVYNTLLLFTLNFVPPPDSGQSLPIALEIARFLAPVVTLLAAVGLAARLFRDEFDLITTRHRVRGHVIVCGLGHVGSTAVALLRSHGHARGRDRTRHARVPRSGRRVRSGCRWSWVTRGPSARSSGRGSRGRRASSGRSATSSTGRRW